MSIWKACAPVLLSESFGLQVSIEKSDDVLVIYLILQFPEVYKIWFSYLSLKKKILVPLIGYKCISPSHNKSTEAGVLNALIC